MKCKVCETEILSHKASVKYCSVECCKEGKRLANKDYYKRLKNGEVRAYANTERRPSVKMNTTFRLKKSLRESQKDTKIEKWNKELKGIWDN